MLSNNLDVEVAVRVCAGDLHPTCISWCEVSDFAGEGYPSSFLSGCSSAWLERSPWKREVVGSNPTIQTMYTVKTQVPYKELRNATQLSYIVHYPTYTVTIAKSGHATLIRGLDKDQFSGGWLFPKGGKVTTFSGTLNHLTLDKEEILDTIMTYLGKRLFVVNSKE